MAGRDAYSLLLASKKPHLQDLVSKASHMSEEEIKALPEKPWVIKGLLMIKEMDRQAVSQSIAEQLADMMEVDPSTIVEPLGDVYWMNADVYWLSYGHSGDFKVEVKYGELLWVNPKTNELSYEHIRMTLTIQQAQQLVQVLKFKQADVTYMEYRRMVADKLNLEHCDAPVLIDQTGGAGQGLHGGRVGNQMVFGYNPL